MDDFRISKSTDMIEHNRCCLYSSRRLGWEQFYLSGEGINDNKYILITMCVFGQWSNMIQMKNFKWIVGRTRESMSLYWDAQAIGNLTVRALSKKFLDHAVGDRVRRLKIHLNMTNLLEATSA